MGSELQPPQISASANCYATTSPARIFTFISSHLCWEKLPNVYPNIRTNAPFIPRLSLCKQSHSI